MSVRVNLIPLLVAFAGAASAANACSVVPTTKSERTAFAKADLVLTVDAASEAYVPVPGQGALRVGVASGRVVEVHKGRSDLKGRVFAYRVVDGEDEMHCPAFRSTRPGGRYKLYLSWVTDSGPPVIIYRDPVFD